MEACIPVPLLYPGTFLYALFPVFEFKVELKKFIFEILYQFEIGLITLMKSDIALVAFPV